MGTKDTSKQSNQSNQQLFLWHLFTALAISTAARTPFSRRILQLLCQYVIIVAVSLAASILTIKLISYFPFCAFLAGKVRTFKKNLDVLSGTDCLTIY
ncbi:hypothetical protein [Siminovitchia sp. 179-K 8D1 HS]|uniref:hypothetical protein n=1 Tax=Siminovitchia sp. 179-K 8D1 HS TaxID=3142385 RepID=UPI00399F1349